MPTTTWAWSGADVEAFAARVGLSGVGPLTSRHHRSPRRPTSCRSPRRHTCAPARLRRFSARVFRCLLDPAVRPPPGAARRPRPWPHRNHAEHIRSARAASAICRTGTRPRLRLRMAAPGARSSLDCVESLTAHVVLPVSIVGPLRVDLGASHVDDADRTTDRRLRRDVEDVYVPLAHSEGGLSASLQRGMAAVLDGGHACAPCVHDRMTRDSCFLFDSTDRGRRRSPGGSARRSTAMRAWLQTRQSALRGAHAWRAAPESPRPIVGGRHARPRARPATSCTATPPARRAVRT